MPFLSSPPQRWSRRAAEMQPRNAPPRTLLAMVPMGGLRGDAGFSERARMKRMARLRRKARRKARRTAFRMRKGGMVLALTPALV